jgi:hypothetical protein
VDARILAQLLRTDLLPEAWIAPPAVRQLRARHLRCEPLRCGRGKQPGQAGTDHIGAHQRQQAGAEHLRVKPAVR